MRIGAIIADIIQIISRKHSDLQSLDEDDHEQYLLVAGTRAMTGNLLIGANGIQSTNLLIKEVSADNWEIRNAADNAYKNIVLASLIVYGNLAFLEDNKEIRAPNVDDYSLIIKGRENTVGLSEVARIRGGVVPLFEILKGKLTGDLDAGSKKITSLAAPVADGDAANKKYVDRIKIIRKTANQTLQNDATLNDDDHLLFDIAANEVWYVEYVLKVNASSAADFDFSVAVPAAATGKFWDLADANAVAAAGSITGIAFAAEKRIDGAAAERYVFLYAYIFNGGNAGQVKLQWCQGTSEAAFNTIYANSFLRATKIV